MIDAIDTIDAQLAEEIFSLAVDLQPTDVAITREQVRAVMNELDAELLRKVFMGAAEVTAGNRALLMVRRVSQWKRSLAEAAA